MPVLAWPDKAVRPYESLWCLTQRFLWLNRPSCADLIKTLQISSNGVSTLSLIGNPLPEGCAKQEALRTSATVLNPMAPCGHGYNGVCESNLSWHAVLQRVFRKCVSHCTFSVADDHTLSSSWLGAYPRLSALRARSSYDFRKVFHSNSFWVPSLSTDVRRGFRGPGTAIPWFPPCNRGDCRLVSMGCRSAENGIPSLAQRANGVVMH
jgi:hypothetical protein